MARKKAILSPDSALLQDIRDLIEGARTKASTVNGVLTMLYWRVGKRIDQEILKGNRAECGENIVHALSTQLQREYSQGFTRRNLFNMIRIAEIFTDEDIVSTLWRQFSWSHFNEIVY